VLVNENTELVGIDAKTPLPNLHIVDVWDEVMELL